MTQTDRLSGIQAGLAIKAPCQAVSNADLTLSGEQTVNGVAVTSGDRVIVKDQDDDTENGIYVVAEGGWSRAPDFDGNRDVVQGTILQLYNSVAPGVLYHVTAANPIVIGTSSITIAIKDSTNIVYAQTQSEIDGSITPSNTQILPGYITRYGENTTPGTTDMSSAFQDAVDGNKGGRVVIDQIILAAGVLLSGSGYDATEIICEGAGEIKLAPDGGTSNFDTSIWAGLIIKQCDRVKLDLKWNGNRSNQTDRESVHCVILAEATNPVIPTISFRETRGDGLYIDRASPLDSGAANNSTNVVVGVLTAYNSADDGRNACSVISCDGLSIGELHSYQVGGTVDSLQMPGGLDLEPNWAAQSITDVNVGLLNVVTAGSTGLGIVGQAITNDATRDWNIQRVKVKSALLKNNGQGYPIIRRARDIDVDISQTAITTRGNGGSIDYADRITAKWKTKFSTNGIILGPADFVYDSDIQVNIDDYSARGIYSTGIGRSRVRGRVYGASSASSTFAINLESQSRALTQTGVIYEVDAPYDGNNVYALYNTPADEITIGAGTCARNCDWSGYDSIAATFADYASSPIPKFNIQGVTDTAEVATGTVTLDAALPITEIDSSGGAVTATLGSGPSVGFIKTIVMTDASASSTVSVTNHETSDPEVITFAAVDDTAVLMWTGTEWITIKLSGASV